LNPFAYSAASPINKTDRTGRYWGEDVVEDLAAGINDLLPYFNSCAETALAAAPIAAGIGAVTIVGVVGGGVVGATYGCAAAIISEGALDYNLFGSPNL
jgi:hypothetical protein